MSNLPEHAETEGLTSVNTATESVLTVATPETSVAVTQDLGSTQLPPKPADDPEESVPNDTAADQADKQERPEFERFYDSWHKDKLLYSSDSPDHRIDIFLRKGEITWAEWSGSDHTATFQPAYFSYSCSPLLDGEGKSQYGFSTANSGILWPSQDEKPLKKGTTWNQLSYQGHPEPALIERITQIESDLQSRNDGNGAYRPYKGYWGMGETMTDNMRGYMVAKGGRVLQGASLRYAWKFDPTLVWDAEGQEASKSRESTSLPKSTESESQLEAENVTHEDQSSAQSDTPA